MSSLGALIQNLRTLKIECDLIRIGNFTCYDLIRKATSLVLGGQTLINDNRGKVGSTGNTVE